MFHLWLLILHRLYIHPRPDSELREQKDAADFDCSAPQRRLPEVRHGAGLYDDCPLDSPRHHRLPLPQQVHHCWRRGRRREGVRGFPEMNAPSLFAVCEGGGRVLVNFEG